MIDYKMILLPFLISVILTPLVKQYSIYCGAYAKENKRTVHHGKISRIGGVAIYLAFIITMAIFVKADRQIKGLVIGSSIMFFTGLIDDLIDIKPLVKLTLEVIAALVLIYFGISVDIIRLPLGIQIDTGIISFIFTIIWVAGITNAVNLIDGLDGLAVGVSSIAAITMLAVALLTGNMPIAITMAALAGACIGFMPYNLNPAKIFMGDTGSTFLGYMLATVSIMGLFKFYAVISFAVPFLILGLPIFDTANAIIRRVAAGRSPMSPDRGHVHHKLIDMGFNQKQAVAILYAISATLGLTAVVLTSSGEVKAIVLLLAVLAAILVGACIIYGAEHWSKHAPENKEDKDDE